MGKKGGGGGEEGKERAVKTDHKSREIHLSSTANAASVRGETILSHSDRGELAIGSNPEHVHVSTVGTHKHRHGGK
jgi:hypothetical protein